MDNDITHHTESKDSMEESQRQMLSIFESIDEPIYVSDPDTHELLYFNNAVQRHVGPIRGRKCFQALQGLDAPCPFCTNDKIFGENLGKSHIWEVKNQIACKWFRCVDKAIRWPDGRMVRFEIATDLSKQKLAEKKLQDGYAELDSRIKDRTAELGSANEALKKKITAHKQLGHALRKERRLLRDLLDLHERERQLVAYEIHDGLAQQLVASLLQLQAYEQQQRHDPAAAKARFETGLGLLADAVGEARRLIGGLRPPILDESGIVAAIEYLISEAAEKGEADVDFKHNLQACRLPAPLENTIFRIVQEGLANARRHSRSKTIEISLLTAEDAIRIQIRDWGIGFDPEQVPFERFGLRGIRERARLFGGVAKIISNAGHGTRVKVKLPNYATPDGLA